MLLQQGAVEGVDVVGIVAQRGEHNQAALFGKGGGDVACVDGLPIGGVVLIKLGNERGKVARLGRKEIL